MQAIKPCSNSRYGSVGSSLPSESLGSLSRNPLYCSIISQISRATSAVKIYFNIMADKEATVYIVDMGASMGEKNQGREESDLEWAMRYVWDCITTTVSTGRKTANAGVLGLRTDETAHDLADDEGYENISVLQGLGQVLMPELRHLLREVRPSNTNDGDALSALVVAIAMIEKLTKKLKYRRKIVLVTNGRISMDTDGLDEITKKLKQDDISLVVLGVDFDDPDYGFKEEEKDPIKAENEQVLRDLAEACEGTFGTMAQAISEMSEPRIKAVRPVPLFKGLLMLGDPETYDSAMTIDVERYPRTSQAPAPSASLFTVRSNLAHDGPSQQSSATLTKEGDAPEDGAQSGLTSVKNSRTYQVEDKSIPGGKIELEREDLAKGYLYGRTAVAISESEENITKLETSAGMQLIGFIPCKQVRDSHSP